MNPLFLLGLLALPPEPTRYLVGLRELRGNRLTVTGLGDFVGDGAIREAAARYLAEDKSHPSVVFVFAEPPPSLEAFARNAAGMKRLCEVYPSIIQIYKVQRGRLGLIDVRREPRIDA